MGFLSWFGTPKVAKGSELLMLDQHKTAEIVKFRQVHSLDDFYGELLGDPSCLLVINSSLNGRIIPMVDCDSNEDFMAAMKRLKSVKIRHAVFSSSPNRHWIFPDMSFKSFDSAWKATCYIPGYDLKYLKFTRDRQAYHIRGELKSENPPSMIDSNCIEPNVVQFTELLNDHFKDARLKSILALKTRYQVKRWSSSYRWQNLPMATPPNKTKKTHKVYESY